MNKMTLANIYSTYLKSPIPEAVEMPAPLKMIPCLDFLIICTASSAFCLMFCREQKHSADFAACFTNCFSTKLNGIYND